MRTERLIRAAMQGLSITKQDLMGPSKHRKISKRRRVLMWRMMKEPGASYNRVAKALGRNHTSIMAGYKAIQQKINERDPEITRLAERLEDALNPPETLVGPDFRIVGFGTSERAIVPPLKREIIPREYIQRAA